MKLRRRTRSQSIVEDKPISHVKTMIILIKVKLKIEIVQIKDIDLSSGWYTIVVENASMGQWALVYDIKNTEDEKLQGTYCSATSASRAIITGVPRQLKGTLNSWKFYIRLEIKMTFMSSQVPKKLAVPILGILK